MSAADRPPPRAQAPPALAARQLAIGDRVASLERAVASLEIRRGSSVGRKGPSPSAPAAAPRPAASAALPPHARALVSRFDGILERVAALEAALGVRIPGSDRSASASPGALYVSGQTTPPPPPLGTAPPAYESSGPTVARLSAELSSRGVAPFAFVRAPGDYYAGDLEHRRRILGAPSIRHLCKTIVMENTRAHPSVDGVSDPKNSRYYAVVVQYAARLSAEKLKAAVHAANGGRVSKKHFNMRLAPEAVSDDLTGYVHNAVTPVGSRTRIPLVLSHEVLGLEPAFFWLGGGEPDLKLGLDVRSFVGAYEPWVLDCTYPPGAADAGAAGGVVPDD